MSLELLKDANPVPPEQTEGSVQGERAQLLLASILAEAPHRRDISSLRRVRVLAAALALAIAALVASVTIPLGGKNNVNLNLLEKASAALPANGPVVHAVWLQPAESTDPKATVRFEEWFDKTRKVDHFIVSNSEGHQLLDLWRISGKGYRFSEGRLHPIGEPYSPGASFLGLIGKYREALDAKRIVLVGPGKIFAKPVYWVRFRCPTLYLSPMQQVVCAERIAIDKHSYLPVASEMHKFKLIWLWNRDHTMAEWYQTSEQSDEVWTTPSGAPARAHILKAELIPRNRAYIRPPGGMPKR